MRLFVAIDVPESIKEHIAFLQRTIIYPGNHLRLIHPKNIHLTLNFLGERKGTKEIIEQLHEISFHPFNLQLSGIGFFPTKENPRVMWVGLEDNKDLFELQKKIDRLFTPKKSFKAHLTIARIKNHIKEEEIIKLIEEADKLQVKSLNFRVKSFKLYQSTLTPIGAVYEVLETFKTEG